MSKIVLGYYTKKSKISWDTILTTFIFISLFSFPFLSGVLFGDFDQDDKRVVFVNYLYHHHDETKKYLDENFNGSIGTYYHYIDKYDYYFISRHLKERDVENTILKKFKIKNLGQLKPHITNAFEHFSWSDSDIEKYTDIGLELLVKEFLDSDGFISEFEKKELDSILFGLETEHQWIYRVVFEIYKYDTDIQKIVDANFSKYEYISQKASDEIIKILSKKLKVNEWYVYKYFVEESDYAIRRIDEQLQKHKNEKLNNLRSVYTKDNLFSLYEAELINKAIEEHETYLLYETKDFEYVQVAARYAIEHKYIGYDEVISEFNNYDYIRYRFRKRLDEIFVENHHPFYSYSGIWELEKHFKHQESEYSWDYRVYTDKCDIVIPLFEEAIVDGIYSDIEEDKISKVYFDNCYEKI